MKRKKINQNGYRTKFDRCKPNSISVQGVQNPAQGTLFYGGGWSNFNVVLVQCDGEPDNFIYIYQCCAKYF